MPLYHCFCQNNFFFFRLWRGPLDCRAPRRNVCPPPPPPPPRWMPWLCQKKKIAVAPRSEHAKKKAAHDNVLALACHGRQDCACAAALVCFCWSALLLLLLLLLLPDVCADPARPHSRPLSLGVFCFCLGFFFCSVAAAWRGAARRRRPRPRRRTQQPAVLSTGLRGRPDVRRNGGRMGWEGTGPDETGGGGQWERVTACRRCRTTKQARERRTRRAPAGTPVGPVRIYAHAMRAPRGACVGTAPKRAR